MNARVIAQSVPPHPGPLNCRWAFVISRGDGAFGAGDPGGMISASARDADLAGLRHDFERGGVADPGALAGEEIFELGCREPLVVGTGDNCLEPVITGWTQLHDFFPGGLASAVLVMVLVELAFDATLGPADHRVDKAGEFVSVGEEACAEGGRVGLGQELAEVCGNDLEEGLGGAVGFGRANSSILTWPRLPARAFGLEERQ